MGMKRYLWILLASLVLLAGCKGAGEEEGDGPFLYYVNTDGTDLVKQEAKSLEGDPKEAVSYLLDALQEKTDTIDYKSAFPQKVTVEDWTLEEGRLKLFFTQDYEDMDQAAEVLLKAAVVQTLTPVSYTHLDVYKRQSWSRSRERAGSTRPAKNL